MCCNFVGTEFFLSYTKINSLRMPLFYEVKDFLQEILVVKDSHSDGVIDPIVFEIKNYKNVHNVAPAVLFSGCLEVMLDQCNLHKTCMDEWQSQIRGKVEMYHNLWEYMGKITDAEDQCYGVMHMYEVCHNPKRPHLTRGFPTIFSSLLAGDIISQIGGASFVDALKASDEQEEQKDGAVLEPILSQSCPW
jgi:hypothetical protein